MKHNNLLSRTLWVAMVMTISLVATAQTPSKKRGVCVTGDKTNAADLTALAPGISWFYNWGQSNDLPYDTAQIDYVPMTWNNWYNPNELVTFLQGHPEVKYLLAFNEPNFLYQANLTPSQAAALWPQLEAIADDFNLKIVSPATNWCGDCVTENGTTYYSPYDWLRDFFTACPDCRVDYVGVHFYMGDKGAVAGSIKALYEQFHKPVWLTEFCMDKNGFGDNGTQDEQRAFMVQLLDWMERTDTVFRYSWFLSRGNLEAIDLLTPTHGQLSMLGNIYTHMSSYDNTFFHQANTRIEAEHYVDMANVSLVNSTDVDGNICVGYVGNTSRLVYNIQTAGGAHQLLLRTASDQSARLNIYCGNTLLKSKTLSPTGGWTNWQTTTDTLNLPAGQQQLRIDVVSGSCDFNWLQLNTIGGATSLQETGGQLQYSISGNILSVEEAGEAAVYDLSGQKMMGFSGSTDLSPLTAGVYILRVGTKSAKLLR